MAEYRNRSVTPSYLSSQFMGETEQSSLHDETTQLLLGEVKEIIPASSPKSLTKRYLEYNVDVQHRDGARPVTTVTFTNCLQINSLAGLADRAHHTLRADSAPGLGSGSKVLLLCIGGNAGQAFIVGGVREDEGGDTGDHQFFFEFNGAQLGVNSDGELQVRFRGATKADGTLADSAEPAAEGSTAVFDRTGGIKLYTPNEAQYVHLDHANRKVEIQADSDFQVRVNGTLQLQAQSDIIARGQSLCSIEVPEHIYMSSAGVIVGAGNEAWMLGTTYRSSQQILHQSLSATMTTLSGLVTTAGTNLAVAAGLHVIPIVGPILGAGPMLAASSALITAGPMFSAMASAIGTFESASPSYLSRKNWGD